MTDDLWVAVLQSVEGNTTLRDIDEACSYPGALFHVVVCRESAIDKTPLRNWVLESLDALPESDAVACWVDYHSFGVRSRPDNWEDVLRLRFHRAQAMAAGLNDRGVP